MVDIFLHSFDVCFKAQAYVSYVFYFLRDTDVFLNILF